ncbi:MAG: CRISPR-associated endonuclease Cas2 [Flavobacteriales bacterium]
MNENRYNAYRIMWVMVMFDLPTDTKKERKQAAKFRSNLLKFGFAMFQFSIYIRHCPTREHADMQMSRLEKNLPDYGKVTMISITDHQFGRIRTYFCKKEEQPKTGPQQLSLF